MLLAYTVNRKNNWMAQSTTMNASAQKLLCLLFMHYTIAHDFHLLCSRFVGEFFAAHFAWIWIHEFEFATRCFTSKAHVWAPTLCYFCAFTWHGTMGENYATMQCFRISRDDLDRIQASHSDKCNFMPIVQCVMLVGIFFQLFASFVCLPTLVGYANHY